MFLNKNGIMTFGEEDNIRLKGWIDPDQFVMLTVEDSKEIDGRSFNGTFYLLPAAEAEKLFASALKLSRTGEVQDKCLELGSAAFTAVWYIGSKPGYALLIEGTSGPTNSGVLDPLFDADGFDHLVEGKNLFSSTFFGMGTPRNMTMDNVDSKEILQVLKTLSAAKNKTIPGSKHQTRPPAP
jgi:hypothetical protein